MTLPSCFQRDFVDASKLPKPLPASPTPVTKSYTDVVQFVKEKKIKEAKTLMRTQHWPIDDPNRGELWLKLCQEHMRETAPCDFYHSTVRESLGGQWPVNMPAFVDPIFDEEYLLSTEGQRRAERVLFVMSVSHPFVTYCPILHPVASLLLHYLPEEQKKTYSRLLRKFRREDEVEKIFSTWQLWIFRGLPFYHLVRVMDCFLLEGVRALYRVAIAILILYVKEHCRNCSREGTQDAESFLDGVIAFCKDMPYNVDKFLKTAYNIQGISGKLLSQELLKSEMYVRSRSSGRTRPTSESAGGGGCQSPGCFVLSLGQERQVLRHACRFGGRHRPG
ncbi:hypothetical protein HPB49_022678 [Dermacentor silvarum]|uniref:Uncharacterized protein n=1 Tax=Dermacentor silvarum TaxID=543639 RepID=A0ACB8CI04_DERSI|nr:hypothetical protein HPB49_022678 [Dermacentor silvarum]